MSLPNTYTDKNETGCCPVPNVDAWDKKEITFADQRFIRMYTRSFFHVPLNMGKIMTKLYNLVEKSGASLSLEQSMILSRDLSPWKAEQLYAVDKPIEGADNVSLSGSFVTRVFEGPYKDAKEWREQMLVYAKERGHEATKIYFFYTTCPKCAKHYGKNYVIGLAMVA